MDLEHAVAAAELADNGQAADRLLDEAHSVSNGWRTILQQEDDIRDRLADLNQGWQVECQPVNKVSRCASYEDDYDLEQKQLRETERIVSLLNRAQQRAPEYERQQLAFVEHYRDELS